MKLDKLVGDRFKERPADCVVDSHALMIRGGYIKNVANGIFSSYPILKRMTKKIEQIFREEMDAIDGQEVSFPVVLPASLWQESGRYESVGDELLRFTDRSGSPMLLGMTHEEPAVQMVREYGQSYAKYPFMIYQIQTKFRDEPRSRAGLIRVREFTMKDGYSFHTSQEDLDAYYARCHHAYERICARAGLKNVISVASDSGMMGGDISHEFMFLTPAGEDTNVLCLSCDYKSNMEAARCIVYNDSSAPLEALKKVHTPGTKTIEAVCSFLGLPVENSCKAVIYQASSSGDIVCAFLRGDLDVNETKLRNIIRDELVPAVITEESGLSAGFLGPYQLKGVRVLLDESLKGVTSLCCGANEEDHHYTGFNIERDMGAVEYLDFAKAKEGGVCPVCGKASLTIARGIEIGNIFQLGTKYTKAMNMQYLDENGELHYPVMGCYGIGVGRLAASVCEESHDEFGPIWPISIAPWQVHLCCMRADDASVKAVADKLYADLQAAHIEVIYDDRPVNAGVMFADADLIGAPIRIIVSPRNLKNDCCEVVTRDKSVKLSVKIDDVVSKASELKKELFAAIPYNS